MATKLLTFWVDEEFKGRLLVALASRGRKLSELIRYLLERWLEEDTIREKEDENATGE